MSQYITDQKWKDQSFTGADILLNSMNSGFKSLRCMNELDPNEIRLLISNNNSKDHKENMKLNLQKNKIDERFAQKILSKFEI